MCKLAVRCDGYGKVKGFVGRCESCQEVWQSSGRCDKY